MRRHLVLPSLVLFFSAAAAAGCGGDGAAPAGAAASGLTYYADIKPIFDAKCVSCHDDGGIGPFTLTSYERAFDYRTLIQREVVDRVMPPWLAADGCADYEDDRSLTEAQIQTVSDWVDGGGLEGDPTKEGPPLDAGPTNALSRVDLTLEMPVEYTAATTPDDYRCFVLDWPESAPTHVTGFRVNAGNPKVVHHVIAFLAGVDVLDEVAALDAEDAEPGYTCFGGSGVRASWIGGWAPGGAGSDFPEGTGVRVEPGSKVILQVHYNSLSAGAQPDRTSLDFRLDAAVEKEAWVQPWTNPQWVAGNTMQIPAGEADVMHAFGADPTGILAGGKAIEVHSAGFHMHTLGTQGEIEIQRQGGGAECMLDIPRWDFHWQGTYKFVEPKVVRPGDKLYIECHWDNTAGHQQVVDGVPLQPKDTSWGEGTTDEMCLGTFYMTEM